MVLHSFSYLSVYKNYLFVISICLQGGALRDKTDGKFRERERQNVVNVQPTFLICSDFGCSLVPEGNRGKSSCEFQTRIETFTSFLCYEFLFPSSYYRSLNINVGISTFAEYMCSTRLKCPNVKFLKFQSFGMHSHVRQHKKIY